MRATCQDANSDQMIDNIPSGFVAYPSDPPTCGEAIRQSVQIINGGGVASLQTWEDCRVGGKLVIREICDSIEGKKLFCADMTGMNANVMFELGYAIARNKRIWLLLDHSYVDSNAQFEQLKILTTVGYAKYSNSEQIVKGFYSDQPFSDLEKTLYDQVIKRNLSQTPPPKIVYLKSLHDTEASIRITNSIAELEGEGIPVIVDDPKESAAQSLTWYGVQVHSSIAVVCHFTSPNRVGARLPNARCALVAGLAFGMDKPVLMLAENNFLAPLDYRDILLQYQTADQASHLFDLWRANISREFREKRLIQQEHATHQRLATELKGLQIGEYIAENDTGPLAEECFVETSAYREALNGNQVLFVGRKGSGKTANLLKLASTLGKSRDNVVCVIKPAAYELEGVIDLLGKYKERDAKGYAIESLWKFLILTEMAKAAARAAAASESAPVPNRAGPPAADARLAGLMQADDGKLSGEFSVRLERCVSALMGSADRQSGVEGTRIAISEALHQRELHDLRDVLGEVLSSKRSVTILIDDLDKPWDKDKRSDLDVLAQFLLGLLDAANRLRTEFRRSDSRRYPVNLNVVIFLRSDIFDRLLIVAREPDKIPYSKLLWGDRELLMRVIEERFVASHEGTVRPEEMWKRYFCERVRGLPPREYFATRILPRPRDLVFFVKAAMAMAVNRNHASVTQEDILDSEKQYSQFAFGNVLIENAVTTDRMEDVVYEFVGCSPSLNEEEVVSKLTSAGVSDAQGMIELLCAVSFLGLETRKDRFRFVDDPQEYRKALKLAQQVARHQRRSLRYQIHPAFWAFLELSNT